MAKAKPSPKKASTPTASPSAPPAEDLPGELQQLARLRAHFPALPAELASSLLAHHDDATCRERGTSTRAHETFRGAMNWARTFGAHASDPAVSAVRVRWFLDCLTSLGSLLAGRDVDANPSDASALDDAQRNADRLLQRAERRARAAAGTHKPHRDALDRALSPDAAIDLRVARLRGLADLLDRWIAAPSDAPPLAAYDLSTETVKSLRDAAKALEAATAKRAAPRQFDRDSPAINAAEGRLYLVMRPLWDDLREAREDGLSPLQLPVTPTLMRGLDLNKRKPAKPAPAKA